MTGKLSDPSLTRAIPERLKDEQLIIKCYTNEAYFFHFIYNLAELSRDASQFAGNPNVNAVLGTTEHVNNICGIRCTH